MKLIIDTNIIVSALLSEDGRAYEFLEKVLDGEYDVYINEEVFREYDDVLHREKFNFDEDIVSYLLDWFRDNAIWVEVNTSRLPMPDEKDRVFYDIAKGCHVRLITGNTKHYPVDELITSLWELV